MLQDVLAGFCLEFAHLFWSEAHKLAVLTLLGVASPQRKIYSVPQLLRMSNFRQTLSMWVDREGFKGEKYDFTSETILH